MKKTIPILMTLVIMFQLSFTFYAVEGSYLEGTSNVATIQDAMDVFRYIAGNKELTESQKKKANVCFNFQLDIRDAMRFFRNVAGKTSLIDDTFLKNGYAYQTAPGLISSIGCEGDVDAPIMFIDGSFAIRMLNGDVKINFGINNIPQKIKWYNAEGYLPCFISEYSTNIFDVKVESFADKLFIDGNAFEVVYSRMTVKNTSDSEKMLPTPSLRLTEINSETKKTSSIQSGDTSVRDYAIIVDKFGSSSVVPNKGELKSKCGTFNEHYESMKTYWNQRLDGIVNITNLPNRDLINAYKAGYIYTMIIKDGTNLNVGENGYDGLWDHDTIGIIATILTLGDYEYAKEYLKTIPVKTNYDDSKWKYSFPYALYLMKTNDVDFINEQFNVIKTNTHYIETDIDPINGIMKATDAIDSHGQWTVDNESALFGLMTYKYICDTIGDTYESAWAQKTYDTLLENVNLALEKLQKEKNIKYIPMSMIQTNEESVRNDVRDANWASMFLFGRWSWDGYLFGANQQGALIEQIDQTYKYGFDRREQVSDTIYNFGGYPHGYYSSAYNAGYGSAALRGNKYREIGIRAYEFMINNSMSGPFGWWEGIDYQNSNSPWDISHAAGGGGSCQHMWGQSVCTKVLIDSLIAEKSDKSLIIGRGIPKEWISDGETISIENYPISNNKRIGFSLTTSGKTITITINGDEPNSDISVELIQFVGNIKDASGLTFDNENGTVIIPQEIRSAKITLK